MHGLYEIQIVKSTNGEVMKKYYACAHPLQGDWVTTEDGHRLLVNGVNHILKAERNGGQPSYTAFSHVEVMVAK